VRPTWCGCPTSRWRRSSAHETWLLPKSLDAEIARSSVGMLAEGRLSPPRCQAELSLGYGVSPVPAKRAKNAAASAQHLGIRVQYLNANFSFGSTDVGPVAIPMKAVGMNGFAATTVPSTVFSLITALKQQASTSRPRCRPRVCGRVLPPGRTTATG
jgi:hypothetical protein